MTAPDEIGGKMPSHTRPRATTVHGTVRRRAVRALLTLVAVAAVAAGSAGVAAPAAARSATSSGTAVKITAGDRDLLVRVRLAGLWEMPAGEMATVKGRSVRVRQVGELIMTQHQKLDRLVRNAAAKLDVTLPDRPNADQRYWLREMEQARGTEFDDVFVQRLREAHGQILPRIALVRADTRDPVVRALADAAADFVKTHLTLLESTGLVEYHHLPAVSEPVPDEKRFVLFGDPRYPQDGDRVRQVVVLMLLGLAGLLTLVLGVRILVPRLGTRVVRPPSPAPPHRRHRPGPAEPSSG